MEELIWTEWVEWIAVFSFFLVGVGIGELEHYLDEKREKRHESKEKK